MICVFVFVLDVYLNLIVLFKRRSLCSVRCLCLCLYISCLMCVFIVLGVLFVFKAVRASPCSIYCCFQCVVVVHRCVCLLYFLCFV